MVTSVSLVVAFVLKSAAIWTVSTAYTSAYPILIFVAWQSAWVEICAVCAVFAVFVFDPATEAEIVARIFNLCPFQPLPKSIATVLPVGEPPSVKSPALPKVTTSPTAPVPPEPVDITETVKSVSEWATKTSFVPAVSVAVPELERVVTNCLRILWLVSLTPLLSVVFNVLTTL